MNTLEQLRQLYEDYAAQAGAAKAKSPYFASVLNLGNDHRNHPCHDQFYQNVAALIGDFAAAEPQAQEVAPVLQWLLQTAAFHREEPTYWYLYAIHGLAFPLIELADGPTCAQLHSWYDQHYRRVERMPVQDKVYKLLGKRAKKG